MVDNRSALVPPLAKSFKALKLLPAYKTAISRDPNYTNAHYNLARAYALQNVSLGDGKKRIVLS